MSKTLISHKWSNNKIDPLCDDYELATDFKKLLLGLEPDKLILEVVGFF